MTLTTDQRRALESQMSAAEVLRRAVEKGKLPSKRFRVEGSPAGNSHLLNAANAELTRKRYGGKVVELVTEEAFYTQTAKKLPTCQRALCAAAAGVPCRDGKKVRAPHRNRLGKKESAVEIASEGMAECSDCMAPAGAACTNPKGRRRKPHADRPKAAPGATP